MTGRDENRRPLFITADEYEVGGIEGGNVGLRFRTAEIEALLPALDLVLRFAPEEARQLADVLYRWADLVGGGREADA